MREADEQFCEAYDTESLQSRQKLIAAPLVYTTCHNMDAAHRDSKNRYRVASAWRKAFVDLDAKCGGRECLRATVWSSTSALLKGHGPQARGTNQFYTFANVVDSKCIDVGHEILTCVTGGEGEDGRLGTGAGRPAESEVQPEPMVDVIEGDMLAAAWATASRGVNALVLCMSNSFKLGTGVTGGSDAQEEEMFRRTDLSLHGNNFASWPLQREECAGVLAYDVSILRLGQDFGYMFLPGNERPTCTPPLCRTFILKAPRPRP